MSVQPPQSIGEQRRVLQEMIRASSDARPLTDQPPIPADAPLWAALTPGWTEALADACRMPGSEEYTAPELLRMMVEVNLLTRYSTHSGAAYYVMSAITRAEVLRPKVLQARGASVLLSTSASIARRVLDLGTQVEVPDDVRRWAQLALHAGPGSQVAQDFDEHIASARAAGDVETIGQWIETARPLAALLEYAGSAHLSIAIAQAGRTIELVKRRQMDFRQLAAFHRRELQVSAVRDLLDGPDDQWALHFIGGGGVGKTMLVRYVTCLLAGGPSSPCAGDVNPFATDAVVARIDFDYLGLDYPRVHPGMLLEWFADDLRQAGNARSDAAFASAADLFDQAHRDLEAEGYRGHVRATQHPAAIAGVRRFIDALRSLNKRVLLVLDTCEELARAGPESGPDSALEETFRLLRALHDGADTLADDSADSDAGCADLRVIFSGRRLLAGAGGRNENRWRAPRCALPERDWLRLHHVRGFTENEAETYLLSQRVPADLIPAVIRASRPDPGIGLDIVRDQPDAGPPDALRSSPYQLRLYMAWALETPPPAFETLVGAATGQYVELRILNRLEDPELTRALPVIATLGHVDRKLLRAALSVEESAAIRIFDALARQEWTTLHRLSAYADRRDIIDLVAGVRDRLVSYFAAHDRLDASSRRRAAEHLRRRTLEEDPAGLDWSDFDAALRVMQFDAADGAEWWASVEARLLALRDSDWVMRLLETLSGPDGAAAARDPTAAAEVPPENVLRPLVLATQARLLATQSGATVGTAQRIWGEVAAAVHGRSTGAGFERLYRCALANRLALGHAARAPIAASDAADFWNSWQAASEPFAVPADAALVIAASEALVEAAELLAESDQAAARALLAGAARRDGDAVGPRWVCDRLEAAIDGWREASDTASVLLAFSRSLAGRALLLMGAYEAALDWLRRSLVVDLPAQTPLFAEWAAPADLPSRLRLEFARAACPTLLSPSKTLLAVGGLPAEAAPAGTPESIDADRLQSLLAALELANARPDLDSYVRLQWLDGDTFEPLPLSPSVLPGNDAPNAHRLVPPRSIALAEAVAAHGRPVIARAYLQSIAAARDHFNLEIVRHAERALLRLHRRYRLNDEGLTADTTLVTAPRVEDRALVWSLAALDGAKQAVVVARPSANDVLDHQWLHTAWQLRHTLDSPALSATIAFGLEELPPVAAAGGEAGYWTASVALDRLEVHELALAHGLAIKNLGDLEPPFDPHVWTTAHPDEPARGLELTLRWRALHGEDPVAIPAELVARLGQRAAADIAFATAELLALRLPHRAALIFAFATDAFAAAGDVVGACMAGSLTRLVLTYAPPRWRAMRGPSSETVIEWYARWRASLADVAERDLPALPIRQVDGQREMRLTRAWLDAYPGGAYRPWVLRVLASSERVADSFESLRAWLAERYTSVVDGQRRLSAEWTGFAASSTAPPPSVAPRPVAAAPPSPAGAPAAAATPGAPPLPHPDHEDLTEWISPPVSPSALAPPVPLAPPARGSRRRLAIGLALAVLLILALVSVLTLRTSLAPEPEPSIVSPGTATAPAGTPPPVPEPTATSALPAPSAAPPVALLSLAVIALGAAAAAWLAFRRLAPAWARLRRLELRIESATGRATQPIALDLESTAVRPREVDLHVRLRTPRPVLAWPPYVLAEAQRGAYRLTVAGLQPYRSFSALAPPELVRELRGLLSGFGGPRPLNVELRPRDELNGLAWEALLALSVSSFSDRSPATSPLRFARVVDTRRPLEPTLARQFMGSSIATTEIAAAVIRRATGGPRVVGNVRWQTTNRLAADVDVDIQVVHLIGTVVQGPSGAAVQLRQPRSYATQVASAYERASPADGSSVAVRPAALHERYPNLRVCVLQGHPESPLSTRSSADRYAATLARAFGADMAAEGVLTIVIPPLEPDVASAAWSRLMPRVGSCIQRGPEAVYPTLAALQQTIIDTAPDRDVGCEIAFDFCVYGT